MMHADAVTLRIGGMMCNGCRGKVERTLAVQVNSAVKFGNIHREDAKKFLAEAVAEVMEFEYDPEFEVYGIDPEDTFKTMKRILRRQKKLAALVSRKRDELKRQ